MPEPDPLPDESSRYSAALADNEDANWVLARAWERPLAFLLPRLFPNDIITCVEFGCGSGLLAAHLPADLSYLGVDKCDHFLKKARNRCENMGGRAFRCFDVRNFDPKEHADLSCAWSFMKHFALREWDAVLAKVLQAGRFAAFDCQVAARAFDDGVAFPHVFVTERKVLSAVAAAGYEVEAEQTFCEFKVGGEPARTVAYWCRRRQAEGDEVGHTVPAPDDGLGVPTPQPFVALSVAGSPVADPSAYVVRLVEGGPPALYRDGKRVTDEWLLEMNVRVPRDERQTPE